MFEYLSSLNSINDFDLISLIHISQNNFLDGFDIKSLIMIWFDNLCVVYLAEKKHGIYEISSFHN
jgi:hypothetical protein